MTTSLKSLIINLVFAVAFLTSILLALSTNLTVSDKMTTIENEIVTINSKLDYATDLIEKQSDVHFSNVVDEIKKSIVRVISYPFTEEGEEEVALYVDAGGKRWNVGTGFSVDETGNILTAYHVVSGSNNVGIVLSNGTALPVKRVVNLPEGDLSILYVDSSVPPVKIYNGNVGIGSKIGFIGFPLGPKQVPITHDGIISAIIPYKYEDVEIPVFTINSIVNRGNSGGPLFLRENGEVVGIINARFASQKGIGISTRINQCVINAILEEPC